MFGRYLGYSRRGIQLESTGLSGLHLWLLRIELDRKEENKQRVKNHSSMDELVRNKIKKKYLGQVDRLKRQELQNKIIRIIAERRERIRDGENGVILEGLKESVVAIKARLEICDNRKKIQTKPIV